MVSLWCTIKTVVITVYGDVARWAHSGSEWIRIKVVAWLQIENKDIVSGAFLEPANVPSWKTYTLTVSGKAAAATYTD